MKSGLMETAGLRGIVLGTIRHTFFEHFCAGRDAEEAGRTARRIWESTGMRAMLNYALEHTTDNPTSDRNLEGFIGTVEASKPLPPSSVSINFFFKFFHRLCSEIVNFVLISWVFWILSIIGQFCNSKDYSNLLN